MFISPVFTVPGKLHPDISFVIFDLSSAVAASLQSTKTPTVREKSQYLMRVAAPHQNIPMS